MYVPNCSPLPYRQRPDLAPRPGGTFTEASLSYNSIYGRVESTWQREGEKTLYTIRIPANCTAEVELPGQDRVLCTAGTYHFKK